MSILNTAGKLAAKGFKIFPCIPGTKRPATYHGFQDATDHPAQVDAWFRNGNKNIGLATGTASGVVVVDVDLYKPEAAGNLMALQETLGELPQTFTVSTPRKGVHRYYRYPEGYDLRSYNNVLAKGVDLRANGGYVVAQGSHCEADKYSGAGDYEVLNDLSIAELPETWAKAWQALNARQDELAAKKAAKAAKQGDLL